jgi:hypothetical protein
MTQQVGEEGKEGKSKRIISLKTENFFIGKIISAELEGEGEDDDGEGCLIRGAMRCSLCRGLIADSWLPAFPPPHLPFVSIRNSPSIRLRAAHAAND